MTERQILVTSALPYANGPIHIGHLVEYLQTDIWVRFQKLRGHRCVYICADDTHGTAIMISARRAGVTEEAWIDRVREEHLRDFTRFGIEFACYGSTNSEQTRQICGEIWEKVSRKGLVVDKSVEQFYDPESETFLADRFVRGTCPSCGATDQYGDHCEKCLTNYAPTDLVDPKSTLSGATPELRKAPHKLIDLERLHDFLDGWTQSGHHLQPEVANYLRGHFLGKEGDAKNPRKELRPWDVTRPPQYFGFEIPDFPGNYWYVWFDAPIGYIGTTLQWCQETGEDFDKWWRRDQEGEKSNVEIYHFIGKDITYFHTLFWPGILETAEFRLPERVHVHGFLTVGGEKMSKSRGTFVKAETYLNHLDPSYLRYYYAAKLGSRLDDIDMNLDEFVTKINSDLVGKVVNLASRSAKFVQTTGLSETYPDDGGLFAKAAAAGDEIAKAYETCDYNRAMRLIMELADAANPFVEAAAPWVLRKDPDKAQELQDVCTVALNLFRQLAIYLAPVLPHLAEKTRELLGAPIAHWDESKEPQTGTPVAKFKHILQRVDPKKVQAMIEDSKAAPEDAANETKPTDEKTEASSCKANETESQPPTSDTLKAEPLAEQITFDDFMKVDLRVAKVLDAQPVEGADKLIQLTLSLGGDVRRNVLAGIKKAYEPEQLVGRLVIMAANLAPRKMRFGVSEGMILAAGPGGEEVFLLGVDEKAQPGQRAH